MRNICLESFQGYIQDVMNHLIALMYDSSLRASKVCSLNKEHLDLDEESIYLPSGIQKGNPPPATLSLESDTIRTLKRYRRDREKIQRHCFLHVKVTL